MLAIVRNRPSDSCVALCKALNIRRYYPGHVPMRVTKIINWGCSSRDGIPDVKIINNPLMIAVSSNKISALQALLAANVPTLEFTTERKVACEWTKAGRVFCRRVLNGHGGIGIVIASNHREVVDAPLYTKEFKKTHEYRVHVFGGAVIDWVQKKKRNGAEHDDDIRNVAGGWIFAHKNRIGRRAIRDAAIGAAAALKLNFCGVDVMATFKGNKLSGVAVAECNTAPGIECKQTLDAYVEAFKNVRN